MSSGEVDWPNQSHCGPKKDSLVFGEEATQSPVRASRGPRHARGCGSEAEKGGGERERERERRRQFFPGEGGASWLEYQLGSAQRYRGGGRERESPMRALLFPGRRAQPWREWRRWSIELWFRSRAAVRVCVDALAPSGRRLRGKGGGKNYGAAPRKWRGWLWDGRPMGTVPGGLH